MFGAFLFYKILLFSLLQLFILYLTFYLFIIICRKRGFHMPTKRKKHLAKEVSTPDARGLKGCGKRLLQLNQPKYACGNLFFAVEESLFLKLFLQTVCCGYKVGSVEITLLQCGNALPCKHR